MPTRPTFREPHPIRAAGVWAGVGVTVAWFMFFSIVAWSARSYGWSTIIAGVLALTAAVVLNRHGDRGVALGVAAAGALGVSIAALVVGVRYLSGDWVLW
ncbi:MAG: hypothetical protein ACRDT8_23305 [Micromonosporaceae bacterium]